MKLTQQELQALLDYDPLTGVLTWKTRTEITMPNASRRKAFNATHAGNVAFTADDGSGYRIGGINGAYDHKLECMVSDTPSDSIRPEPRP